MDEVMDGMECWDGMMIGMINGMNGMECWIEWDDDWDDDWDDVWDG